MARAPSSSQAPDPAQRLRSLSAAKRQLVIQRHPLSFSQRRLWFLERLYGDKALYNGASLLRLRGALDASALTRTLGEIVRRHRILNSAFPEVDGQPVQWPLPWSSWDLPVVDLQALGQATAAELATDLLHAANRRPFDLDRGPLLMLGLMRLAVDDHILLISAHHIVSDRWSQAVFIREITVLYQAFQHGQSSPLPEPKLQYLDFARWQTKRLQGERLEQGLEWWHRHLHGVEPLELLADHPRPAKLSFKGTSLAFPLATDTARLETTCSRLGVTPFMLGLGVFALLLERYSGRSSFLLGSVVAGRDRIELEELIGFFAATLVLPWGTLTAAGDQRSELRKRTAHHLIEQARRCVLAVQEHGEIPFEMLVEHLAPQRDASRHPLFQVVFAVHNTPTAQLQLGDLQLEALAEERRTARMDLLGTLETFGQDVFLQVEFSSELFDTTTVRRFAGHFDRLLDAVLTAVSRDSQCDWQCDWQRDVETFEVLSSGERCQLLHEWQDTQRPGRPRLSVCHRVWRQAQRRPDATVLVDGDHHISFATLHRHALVLADRMRQAWGQGSDRIIAVCLPRCVEMVIAQLAVGYAGAAFLQIDPELPLPRQQWLLQDSGAIGVLTRPSIWRPLAEAAADLPPFFDVDLIRGTDTDSAHLHSAILSEPEPVHPENLAYIIYTSGSTGRPKGVVVSHGSLTNLADWYQHSFQCTPADRASQTFGLGFDGMVFEIWSHISAGACLDLLDLRGLTIADFARWLQRRAVSLVMLVTPVTEQLLRVEWPGPEWQGVRGGPRAVITGGDALHGPPPPGYPFRLYNLYGPTETTVIATWNEIPPRLPYHSGIEARPSIGRPLTNLRARILDARGRLAPIGVQGELHIGGPSLARGYHDRSRLTAENFVPDAWATTAGDRLYATGDLTRFLPDGRIDFLGRRDHQVKIRGFRIEPGEVASRLRQHAEVDAAAVLARQSRRSGDLRLEAFVVSRSELESTDNIQAQLIEYLRTDLPEYMMPSVWHFLDVLPLTANQKLDRRALQTIAAAWESTHEANAAGGEEGAETPPRDELEEGLLALWSELLPGQPHMRTDFFAAGGHSLLAVRLMAEVGRRFDAEMPLSVLFEAATPERFADRVRHYRQATANASSSHTGKSQVTITTFERPVCVALASGSTSPTPNTRPLFLMHPVGGEVLCYVPLARRLAAHCPVYGLQSPDPSPTPEPAPSGTRIEALAERYVDALRSLQPTGPYRLAGWSMGGITAFEMARQLQLDGQQVEWLVLIDVRAPMLRLGAPHLQGAALRRAFERDVASQGSHQLLHQGQGSAALEGPFERFRLNYEALYAYGRDWTQSETSRSMEGSAPRVSGQVHVWRAAEGANADLDAPALGWAELIDGTVLEATLPGDHYSLLQPPQVDVVAQRLRALLQPTTTR